MPVFNNRSLKDTAEVSIFVLLFKMLKFDFYLPICFKGKDIG